MQDRVRRGATLLALVLVLAACSSSGGTPDQGLSHDAVNVEGVDDASDASADEVSAPVAADCRPNADPFPVRPAPTDSATLPFLHVDGRDVVDEAGTPVALRGVNFGSWLMMETWLAGIGVLDEGALLDLMPVQAAEMGVADLLEGARRSNQIDWLLERRTRWLMVQEWRAWMSEHATPEQAPGVEAFWAWFDTEPWIFEERSLWRWLDGRFGWERSRQLRAAFQDHYVTELDVERFAALGLNTVRVPIWYQLLETDVDGDNHFVPEGWRRLDDLLSWARRHRVYVVLDLHGAPGGQNTAWHQGLENGGVLWHRVDCVDKTVRLWQALAAYVADEPHVAALDLLNEPDRFVDLAAYRDVHDAVYRAVREVDDRHIVMLEDGYRAPDLLVSPAELGWTNAMVSVHLYPEGATSAEAYAKALDDELVRWARLNDYDERFDCPLYVGEFNAEAGPADAWGPAAMDLAIERLDLRGVHWAAWAWKWPWMGATWSVYAPPSGAGRVIDVKEASFEQILDGFVALDSATFEPYAAYAAVLQGRALDSPSPLDLSEVSAGR